MEHLLQVAISVIESVLQLVSDVTSLTAANAGLCSPDLCKNYRPPSPVQTDNQTGIT